MTSRFPSRRPSVKLSPRHLARAALTLAVAAVLGLGTHHVAAQTAPNAVTAPAATPQLTGPIPAPKKKKHKPRRRINWLNPAAWPVMPVPLIATDPVNGTTYGILPTYLGTNSQNQITEIIAPDINHNQYFGWGGDGRILGFPSEDTQWSLVAGAQQRVESNFDALFETGLLRETPFSFTVESLYDRNGTPRFYGIGNNSLQINQTVYIDQQVGVDATLGWNLTHAWQLAYTFAASKVKVLGTTLAGVPPITRYFHGTYGIGTTHELLNRFSLGYDTRDDIVIPTSGMQVVLYGGVASRNVALDDSLFTEAGGDGRFYWSPQWWSQNRSLTIAAHVDLRYEPTTHRVPFWALSSIGGDQSVIGGSQPLRGYGASRWYDRDSFVANLELRQRVLSMDAFSTHIEVQVTPFIDTGRVFHTASDWPITHLHSDYGVGFRGLAPPSVVGYVDVGEGSAGMAIFTGINYPF